MKRLSHHSAFSLAEVAIALGISAFCLLSLFGLLVVGIKSTESTIEQTTSASIARALTADLRNTPASAQRSPTFDVSFPTAGSAMQTLFFGDAGDVITPSKPDITPRYRATLMFASPTAPYGAAAVRILITWPALADTATTVAPTKYSGAYEIVTALRRY